MPSLPYRHYHYCDFAPNPLHHLVGQTVAGCFIASMNDGFPFMALGVLILKADKIKFTASFRVRPWRNNILVHFYHLPISQLFLMKLEANTHTTLLWGTRSSILLLLATTSPAAFCIYSMFLSNALCWVLACAPQSCLLQHLLFLDIVISKSSVFQKK